MKTLLLTLLFIPITSLADDWKKADTQRESVYLVLHTVDWLQTRTLAKQGWPDGRAEKNPMLGKYPSTKKLDLHFVITSAGHYYIGKWLPSDWRLAWQYIAIVDSGAAVYGNHRLGVRIKF